MSDASLPALNVAVFNRQNPFRARLVRQESLTKPGSLKETRHFVLSLEGSGLTYTPGDSLAVFARNPVSIVDEVIQRLRFDPDAPVRNSHQRDTTFREALRHDYILNRANKKILTALAERIPSGEPRERLQWIVETSDQMAEYLHTRDYVDILREFPEAQFESPAVFLAQLSPIPPRLYSIASSLQAHPDEVHLCVAVVRYRTHDRDKAGLATGFLADQTVAGQPDIPVYVQETKTFRLPADPQRDVILIGPGTGIAPFRAFIEQRILDRAPGRHWVFFGEQHRATDFLYETEFLQWLKNGHLHRLDLAFSRDQPEKIYVQHRMLEQARELWDWLQQGAYLYVCGDARHMAKDVHQTLIHVAREQGGLTPEAASDYINVRLMKTERRYLRDIY